MGGILRAPPSDADLPDNTLAPPIAPTLAVHAQKDPNEAPLERLQIVKGWLENGVAAERIYDVACMDAAKPDAKTRRCPSKAPAPSTTDCSLSENAGAADLQATWTDPDYKPNQSAFYYARAIQVPTCRWSTFDALRTSQPPNKGVPAWIQERAIGSPIWVEAR